MAYTMKEAIENAAQGWTDLELINAVVRAIPASKRQQFLAVLHQLVEGATV
ncbi:hypothetical protein BurMR1_3695 [Burkholderia sp. MR1]|nr:hypothetical protein BurMR1_3695 [Burkholderia sp. MR1]